MRKWWKQLWCVHWWGEVSTVVVPYGAGPIIATQQRQFERTDELRTCSRCDLVDSRTVNVVCTGWD